MALVLALVVFCQVPSSVGFGSPDSTACYCVRHDLCDLLCGVAEHRTASSAGKPQEGAGREGQAAYAGKVSVGRGRWVWLSEQLGVAVRAADSPVS